MKNKIVDLRNHLFETIEMLKDPESGMSVDKAKAIADLSQTIINSEKLVHDYIRMCDKTDGYYANTGFIEMNTINPEQKAIKS